MISFCFRVSALRPTPDFMKALRQALPRGNGILIHHQASIGIQSGHRMLQRISRKMADFVMPSISTKKLFLRAIRRKQHIDSR